MRKELLAREATTQYSRLRSYDIMLRASESKKLHHDRHRSSLDVFSFENQQRKEIRQSNARLASGNLAAKSLYSEHHAELYAMAEEDMRVAELEETSPLDALGARIIRIRNMHLDRVDQALEQ